MDVKGMAALVTGGGSGLGAATARRLAAAGARVTVLDVNLGNAEAVAREIGGFAVLCDVSSAEGAATAIAAARDRHGPARIAVNCAGIGTPAKVLGKEGPHSLDLFRRVIEVNLIGTFNVLRLAADDMQRLDPLADGERGVIVNTASIAAFDGQIGQAAYGASKGGVHALTLPAARELARFGIRVVTIAPGLFLTPMMLGLPQEAQDSLAASVPFPPRLGRPEEYADLVHFICTNTMVNGETIRLDGALRMAPK
ncbi:SDR family NAD(P)-dependent oxidoreductase [Rhodospirillum centenum]|uniref:3-hydroxyacyl-CoA dehydrogenase type II n=1 Tax=Rhodospirillum centenum (strain ATCC 51521 / SW) TaxID=414684 RepID=B6IUG5_RHOCS|nr:SDR family NAD(P)-dependent oxidoreductase [Rhodospirillum centenum]ACI99790.1 3-hydroxyacyl-CoA dehydrogenase type II [Rhodospirillum centenum SW]